MGWRVPRARNACRKMDGCNMDNSPHITSLPPEVLSVILDYASRTRGWSNRSVDMSQVCKQWRLLSLAHGTTLDPIPFLSKTANTRKGIRHLGRNLSRVFLILAQDPLRVAALRLLTVSDWSWPHLFSMPHLWLNVYYLHVALVAPVGTVSPLVTRLAEALIQSATRLRLIRFPDVCSFLLFASSFDSSEHLAGIAQKIEIGIFETLHSDEAAATAASIDPATAPTPCDLSFLAVSKSLGGPFTTLHKLSLTTQLSYISPMICQESGHMITQHCLFPNVEALTERNRTSSALPYMDKLISYRTSGTACPSVAAFSFHPSVSSTLSTISMDFAIFPPNFDIHGFSNSLATLSELKSFEFKMSILQTLHLRLLLKALSCAMGLEHLLLGVLHEGNDNDAEEVFVDEHGVVQSTWDLAPSFPKLRTCEFRVQVQAYGKKGNMEDSLRERLIVPTGCKVLQNGRKI
ncbi:hypothetical protein BJ741DRAFT_594732 [Chytriomyces cf. hyalinus JEL632]|nr:hypothetical protein BJ741DRAFT_594732 [Chytriomyces cf. hyalinus JEL632]